MTTLQVTGVRLAVYSVLALMIVGTGYIWYTNHPAATPDAAVDTEPSGDTAVPSGTLYFSGTPDNGFNLLPTIFSLSLPDGDTKQISGEGEELAFSRNYVPTASSGNAYLIVSGESFNESFTRLEPVVIPSGTAHNTSENNAIPNKRRVTGLHQEAGLFSHSLAVAPQDNRIAYVSHIPETVSSITPDTLPSALDFATWTVTVIAGQGQEDSNARISFADATRPLWFSDDHILFLREDAIYVHDFIENVSAPLIPASDLDIDSFSVRDSFTTLDDSTLLVHLYDTNQIVIMQEAQDAAIAVHATVTVPDADGGIQQLQGLTADTFAALHISSDESTADTIAVYQIEDKEITPVRRYSLAGVTLPQTTQVDSWMPYSAE